MTTDTNAPPIRTLDEVEMAHVLGVLGRCGWKKAVAATLLGVAVKTVYNLLNSYEAAGLIEPDGDGYRLTKSGGG